MVLPWLPAPCWVLEPLPRRRQPQAMADLPVTRRQPPRVAGLHLQFGADASREVVVSSHTPQQGVPVRMLSPAPNHGVVVGG